MILDEIFQRRRPNELADWNLHMCAHRDINIISRLSVEICYSLPQHICKMFAVCVCDTISFEYLFFLPFTLSFTSNSSTGLKTEETSIAIGLFSQCDLILSKQTGGSYLSRQHHRCTPEYSKHYIAKPLPLVETFFRQLSQHLLH